MQEKKAEINDKTFISLVAVVMLLVLCLPVFFIQQELQKEIRRHENTLLTTAKENLTQGIIDFQSDLSPRMYINTLVPKLINQNLPDYSRYKPLLFGEKIKKILNDKYGLKPLFLIAANKDLSCIYKNYSKKFNNIASSNRKFEYSMPLTSLYPSSDYFKWLFSLPHIRKLKFYKYIHDLFSNNPELDSLKAKVLHIFGKFAVGFPTPRICTSYYTDIFNYQRLFIYSFPLNYGHKIYGSFIVGFLESDIDVSKMLKYTLNKKTFNGSKRILATNLNANDIAVLSYFSPSFIRMLYTQKRINPDISLAVKPDQKIGIRLNAKFLKSNMRAYIPRISFINRLIVLFVFFLWIRGILFRANVAISLRRKFMLIVLCAAIFPVIFISLFSFLIYQQIDKFHINNAVTIVSDKLDQFERLFYEASCRQVLNCLGLKKMMVKKFADNNYKTFPSNQFPPACNLISRMLILDTLGETINKPSSRTPNPILLSQLVKAQSNLGVLENKSKKIQTLKKISQVTSGIAGEYLDLIKNSKILTEESMIENSPSHINAVTKNIFNLYKDYETGKHIFAASFLQSQKNYYERVLFQNVKKYQKLFNINRDGISGTSQISFVYIEQSRLKYLLGDESNFLLKFVAKNAIRDKISGRKIVERDNKKILIEWRYKSNSGFVISAMAYVNKEMKLHTLLLFLPAFMGAMSLMILVLVAEAMSGLFNSPIRTLYNGAEQIRKENDYLSKVSINTKDEIEEIGVIFNYMTTQLQTRKNMSRFVSEKLLATLDKSDNVESYKGEKSFVTVLCCDIRSFTTITETYEPDVIVELLNEYFALMEKPIIANKGVIDKFIGDAIVAVFYSSGDEDNSVLNACKAAIEMRQSLKIFNSAREKMGLFTIENGIGISYGEIISGNVGDSSEYLEFTITGRPINRANELETESKKGKFTKVILDSDTADKINDKYLLLEFNTEKSEPAYEIKHEK